MGVTFRVARPGKLSHRIEITSDGKVLAAATSTLKAQGTAPASADSQTPSIFGPSDEKPKDDAAKKASKPKAGAKSSDDDSFRR